MPKDIYQSKKICLLPVWSTRRLMHENNQVMVHPYHSEAWKAPDDFDVDFTRDARNVCSVLATHGFSPYNMSAVSHSCWPIIAIPCNLPPCLCMNYEYMFLCLIIPGPDHPGTCLNVMLKPSIEELKQMWQGVKVYDYDQKQKFNLQVAYLWLVHNFRAYNIFSGWSCNGILTCLICLKVIPCSYLKFGGKISYFYCHRCFLG
jgi:hypothetical protein